MDNIVIDADTLVRRVHSLMDDLESRNDQKGRELRVIFEFGRFLQWIGPEREFRQYLAVLDHARESRPLLYAVLMGIEQETHPRLYSLLTGKEFYYRR
jgi:hypothetical protein